MGKDRSVLIDINIILDVLLQREPFYSASAGLLAAVEKGKISGYVSAHGITTLFYILQKGKSSAEAHAIITGLFQILKVAPVGHSTIEQALNLQFRDFEDAVQMVCAMEQKVDCLITRNVRDYQVSLLPVLQPVDYLATL